MSLTTKDLEQAKNFKKCLGLEVKIGKKFSGEEKSNICLHVQFGDIIFYEFLKSIGLTSAKSKTIGKIKVPDEYFFDYLRGCFDGDGSFHSYWDPRWRSSHMFYLVFCSASMEHVLWLQKKNMIMLGVHGHTTKAQKSSVYCLKYAKKEALEIIRKMYYNPEVVCLSRKRLKIMAAIRIEKKQQIKYK